jgi:membrane fusion protein, multidrug efflux system
MTTFTPSSFRPARRPRVAFALALPLALAVVSCGDGKAKGPSGPPPVPVTTATVVQKTVPVTFRAIGHVEPIAAVAVKARIGGELQRVAFTEGESVRAGATLFTIDPRPYRAALAQAEAGLARNQALLAKAEADATRYAGLVRQDYVTKEQYDQIVANAAALRAAIAADQANVDAAKLNLAYCTITAPVAGRTGALTIKAGNLVKANDDKPLVTINQVQPIHVAFSVPAQLLPSLTARREDAVKVAATLPGGSAAIAEGTLSFIDNEVDADSGTLLLKATFANADEVLWPGQFVDLTVRLGEEAARMVVPASAVQSGQRGQYAFVVKDDGTVELRTLVVARGDEKEAIVESGLAPGETVVTDGQLRLVPGAKVVVKSAENGSEPKS